MVYHDSFPFFLLFCFLNFQLSLFFYYFSFFSVFFCLTFFLILSTLVEFLMPPPPSSGSLKGKGGKLSFDKFYWPVFINLTYLFRRKPRFLEHGRKIVKQAPVRVVRRSSVLLEENITAGRKPEN